MISSRSKSPKSARISVIKHEGMELKPSITGPSCTKNIMAKATIEMQKVMEKKSKSIRPLYSTEVLSRCGARRRK